MTAIGGGILSFSLALMYVLLFPSIQESFEELELPEYMESFSGAAGSYSTPEGYLATEFFTAVPITLVIFAIVAGTAATAGEESAGTLELLLAQPIRRRRVIIEKAGGIGAAVSVALLAGLPGIYLGQVFVDLDVGPLRTLAAMMTTLPLLFVFAALAMVLGASLPTRALAVAGATALAVIAYVVHTVGALVDSLSEVRKLTPFYWSDASRALVGDFEVWRSVVLLTVSVALVGLAAWAFERRDVAGGGREIRWRRWLRFRRTVSNGPTIGA
ncbi:MAG: ABC transporter permease subunit [Chloroflexi bacterium]|nr:ABC transporter permease subunit [Chloroflexota bacterium]